MENQYNEVIASYTNPDGTKKEGWLKAPNGKPTNLSERQWVQVRTPAFKKWFGDWEKLYNKYILEGSVVASVHSADIPILDGKIINTALDWIRKHPIRTVKTRIGNVTVTNDGIKADFGHTRYPSKLYVLPAIKSILENGAYLNSMSDFYGKNINNHYFAAPVELDGERKLVFLRIREKEKGKSFYVHEVFIEEEVKKSETLDFILSKSGDRMQTVDPQQDKIKASDLYRSILNDALSVNPSQVSKLIDENGEPLMQI
ncbi:MAG: hypothetical protein Ta2G_17100 [Termitinemataceae bacterium]|nr:MAG: hypothetical protein Ta2G_17100 [Termitinemataceae bacterium]